jgi:glutamate racemase
VNFDAAVLELVLAFGAGATMVILPPKLVDGDDVGRLAAALVRTSLA